MNACPLCHNRHVTTTDAASEFNDRSLWMYCPACELYFLSEIPSNEALQRFYAESYFAPQKESGAAYRLRAWFSAMRAQSQYRYISHHCAASPGKILEVGSSDGSFLARFKEQGWKVLGLEYSEFGRQKAHDRYGITLLPREVTSLDPGEHRFDCIAFSHVIEHMSDPTAVLEHAGHLLEPAGRIFIEVPHSPLPGETDADTLEAFLHTTHIYNYRMRSLEKLVASAGLTAFNLERYFYSVPGFQRSRESFFGNVLMTSRLSSRNPMDYAHLLLFLLYINGTHLTGGDAMMLVRNERAWMGLGDNIRVMAG